MYCNIRTTHNDGTHLVQKHRKIHSAIRATRVFVGVVQFLLALQDSCGLTLKGQIHLVHCIKCLIDTVIMGFLLLDLCVFAALEA